VIVFGITLALAVAASTFILGRRSAETAVA
jgi:hypothetical protein